MKIIFTDIIAIDANDSITFETKQLLQKNFKLFCSEDCSIADAKTITTFILSINYNGVKSAFLI